MKKLFVVWFLAIFVCFAIAEDARGQNFNTTVTGNQQVPPVATPAISFAVVSLIQVDTVLLSARLNFFHNQRVTEVHIHEGAQGQNGEDVKELVETVISDSWSFPDLRP